MKGVDKDLAAHLISKEEGGKWGMLNLDKKYSQFLSYAIGCYKTDKNMNLNKKSSNLR